MGLRDNWVEFKLVNGGLATFDPASIICIEEQVPRKSCDVQLEAGVHIQRQNGHDLFLNETYTDVKAAIDMASACAQISGVLDCVNAQASTSEDTTDNGGEKNAD